MWKQKWFLVAAAVIALLSLIAASSVSADAGILGGGGEEPQTAYVKPSSLESHDCDNTEWHFVINQVDVQADAPASIHVTWAGGHSEDVSLDEIAGGTAHYATTEYLDSAVTSASAVIYSSWGGEFNLSPGPCGLATSTSTKTSISTRTVTRTSTSTKTSTPTVTSTATPINTATWTATSTRTATRTSTRPAGTPTNTPTATPTVRPPICKSLLGAVNGQEPFIAGEVWINKGDSVLFKGIAEGFPATGYLFQFGDNASVEIQLDPNRPNWGMTARYALHTYDALSSAGEYLARFYVSSGGQMVTSEACTLRIRFHLPSPTPTPTPFPCEVGSRQSEYGQHWLNQMLVIKPSDTVSTTTSITSTWAVTWAGSNPLSLNTEFYSYFCEGVGKSASNDICLRSNATNIVTHTLTTLLLPGPNLINVVDSIRPGCCRILQTDLEEVSTGNQLINWGTSYFVTWWGRGPFCPVR